MTEGLVTMSILFRNIFCPEPWRTVQQETAKRGNIYGIVGMVIAIVATFSRRNCEFSIVDSSMLGGALIGAVLAKRVEMTSMPSWLRFCIVSSAWLLYWSEWLVFGSES